MALLTASSGSVVPDSVPPRSKGWQRVEDGQKTDPCHCHSDLILGPFPGPSHICRSGMVSMDQRKWLVGFQPVPLSPLPFHLNNSIWVRNFRGDPIISPRQSVLSSLFQMSLTGS